MKREVLVLWILTAVLIIEVAMISILLYASRLLAFFNILFIGVRIIAPILFAVNVVFLIYALFGKGKAQTARSWSQDLRNSVKFFVISVFATLVTITLCSFLGALLGISADRISNWPTLQQMREWVASQLY